MADSSSQASELSQTAQEYINSQLELEHEAREALPYQFDSCTKPLGPLRQSLFSCLTCNPPSSSPSEPYHPAGVCYSCSISCHGAHQLVELFNKRDFVCDCGTTRMPATSPCSLRSNETGSKGGVHSEEPAPGNKYNQNFRNRFCGCAEEYDPHTEKGTMFQCIGLGSVEDGGCGEDWWHPECVVGLPRNWNQREKSTAKITTNGTEDLSNGHAQDVGSTVEDGNAGDSAAVQLAAEQDDDPPMPPDFPSEDQFEHFICFKCVEAFPWIKRYAGNDGFLPGVSHKPQDHSSNSNESGSQAEEPTTSKKRKADYTGDTLDVDLSVKRQKSEEGTAVNGDAHREIGTAAPTSPCSYEKLPPAPSGPISLFLKEDFRSHLCRCSTHFPLLKSHPALLDDELTYSPPLSRSSSPAPGSVGSRSLLERGEAALSNVDRVRAIEGVMVYNHLRDKVKDFLRPYAETGQAVGAEDIKQYFEQLRGDQEAIKQAGVRADGNNDDTDGGGDSRREQSGY